MKKLLRFLWWEFSASSDDKYDILYGSYMRAHRERAAEENNVGHTNECCNPIYP